MSEEIVITYKTETLKIEDFNEREKAIYSAGYSKGFLAKQSKWQYLTVIVIFAILLIGLMTTTHGL